MDAVDIQWAENFAVEIYSVENLMVANHLVDRNFADYMDMVVVDYFGAVSVASC